MAQKLPSPFARTGLPLDSCASWCATDPFGALLGWGYGMGSGDDGFEEFVRDVRPRLLRGLAACRGVGGAEEAAAEAIAWAWEHWEEVCSMVNPAGYLYRVGQSRTRHRRHLELPPPADLGVPEVEPALIPALLSLPETQRTAVWLVHACGWRYEEVAEAIGTSVSMVGNHVARALERLRRDLGVDTHA